MPKAQGPEPIDLNILPEQYRPRVTPPIIRIVWIVAAVLTLSLLPGFILMYSVRSDVRDLDSQARRARGTLQALRTPAPEMAELNEELERLQQAAEAIQTLHPTVAARYRDWAPVLDAILQYDSEHIQLQTFFQDGDDLSLSGLARTQDDVLHYANRLEDSGVFQRVIIQSIERSDQPLTVVPHPGTPASGPDGTPPASPGEPPDSTPTAPLTAPDLFYDAYEIDDHEPKSIALGETQWRNFNPTGDIDQAVFVGQAGVEYCVQGVPRAAGVSLSLQVTVGGQVIQGAECGAGAPVGPCACPGGAASGTAAVVAGMRAPASGHAQMTIRITNRGEFGPDNWYTLRVVQASGGAGDTYEPDDLAPVPLRPGETQRRTFDPAGDVDRVEIPVRAGYTYTVRTTDLAPEVDTVLSVLVHGAFYRHEDVSATDLSSQVVFTAVQDGVAGVSITNRGQYGPDKAYTVTVTEHSGGEPPALTATAKATLTPQASGTPSPGSPTATATPDCGDRYEPDDTVPRFMVPGSVQERTFCPTGDRDRAVFTAKAGRSYRIETVNLAPGVDTMLTVQFGGAVYANDDRAPGDLGSSVDVYNRSGDAPVFITVTNKGQYDPTMRYDLQVRDISGGMDDAYEPDDLSGAEIRPGAPQQRTFNPKGDIDKVFFLAAPHHVYRVYTSNLAEEVDTHLTVELAGRRLEHDNRSGTDLSSFIEFQNYLPHHTGVIITIRNLSEKDEGWGPDKWYMIHLDDLGEGDPYEPDDVNGVPIQIGAPQQRAFHPHNDVDRVRFTAQPYRRYVVQTYSLAPGVDTVLNLYVDARYLNNDDRAPGDASSYLSFYHDGTDPAQVTVYIGNKGQFGVDRRYMVRVDDLGDLPDDAYEPDLEVERPIAPGEVQQRTFDPAGDIDQVVLMAEPGKRYAVMTCGNGAMPSDPVTGTVPFDPEALLCDPLMPGVDTIMVATGPVQHCGPSGCMNDRALPDSAYTNSRIEFEGMFASGSTAPVEVTIRIYNKGDFGPNMLYYVRAYELGSIPATPTPTPTRTPTTVPSATPTATSTSVPSATTPTPTATTSYPGPVGYGRADDGNGDRAVYHFATARDDVPLAIKPLMAPPAQDVEGETVQFMLLLRMRPVTP